jgi:uncharacterized protein YjiS (DUF1127 family)
MTALVANTFNLVGITSMANWFNKLNARLEKRRKINRTIQELEALTDFELADIGISRGMIKSVAHETYNPQANDNLKGWV